jgi:L-2-hydroxyglutarate oxidase
MTHTRYDVAVIGAGIVGLATAYQFLQRFPGRRIAVLEKESGPAHHQTGRNSGVLHSGIYYAPGSLKAVNCRQGKAAMEQFCEREGIPFERCGKVIVAVSEGELPALERIYERGKQNHVRCRRIDASELAELEPFAAGVGAIHVPEAGIVDYGQVSRRLADRVTEAGGEIVYGTQVTGVKRRTGQCELQTTTGPRLTGLVINCGGLQSDRIARQLGTVPPAKIIPFRGEYYQLLPEARRLCRNLIYPVPDPKFPFLGVHLTRMIDGSVECGPNAVLALAREGYGKLDVNLRDAFESLTYPGFLRLAARYWRVGAGEVWRSMSKGAFVRAVQRLVPDLQADHLLSAPSGIRAQAITADGRMVDDFLILESPWAMHVCNAPSPAATSALNIGRLIVDRLAHRWEEKPADAPADWERQLP